MISIFNGRERTLGGSTSEIYAQINVDFRQHLHILKGARLSIFLAISLHANSRGWAWPSRSLLARETGYNVNTISLALSDLCKLEINGQRLLLRHQPATRDGTYDTNQYLIFPSHTEVTQFEHSQPPLLILVPEPCTEKPCTVEPYTVKPCTVQPCTENPHTNHNHAEGESEGKGETKAEAEAAAAPTCSIHDVEMKLRRKGTDTWYSHELPNGDWCKGDERDQPQATLLDTQRYITGEYADLIQH